MTFLLPPGIKGLITETKFGDDSEPNIHNEPKPKRSLKQGRFQSLNLNNRKVFLKQDLYSFMTEVRII